MLIKVNSKPENKGINNPEKIANAISRDRNRIGKTFRYVLFGLSIPNKSGGFTSYRIEFIKHSINA